MASTNVLIVYATGSKILRGFVSASDDGYDLSFDRGHVQPGETGAIVARSAVTAVNGDLPQALANHLGVDRSAIPSSRHAVVDASGNVVAVAHVDPALDSSPAGHTFVQTDHASAGWKHAGGGQFVAPVVTKPSKKLPAP